MFFISSTYGHGEDKNTAAQLAAHAILGGALAYINGGNAAAGAGSAVAAESIADYLTQPYKDKSAYQNANGEFEANRLPEDVKAQIRDLSSAIGAVVGGVVGDSSNNAQIGGVIGQNAVENNAVSDIADALAAGKKPEQQAKERTQQLRLQGCAAAGLVGEACSVELRRQGYEIAQETAGILLPTTIYEVVPIGKGVGLAIKGTKKLVAIYKDSKTAKNAAEKAGAKVDSIAKNSIPNAHQASIDPNKIIGYALNKDHPVGGNKAKVFESALGYNKSNANDLITKLQEGVRNNPAVLGKSDQYGQRFTVDIPVKGPNGNTAVVRTGWILDIGSSIPRLATAYVNK